MPPPRVATGLHANRPAVVSNGTLWFSSDQAGGTLYIMSSGTWNQVITGGGGGGPTYDDASFDFGSGDVDSVTVSVVDTLANADTTITGTLAPGPGRAADEMEMEQFTVSVIVTAGVGFDLVCKNLSGGAHGVYVYHYAKGN